MIKKRLKNKTGQVAIFVLLMFSLIFMFFGMAINIGMLVHHKINLQNAVDMGALAAAAEQARILNMIGWKNYELRKNFKDFIYRYWVGFNDRHEAFPDPRDRKRRGNVARSGKWTEVFNTIPSYCFGDNFDDKNDRGGFKACEISQEGASAEVIGPPPALINAMAIEPISATLLAALHLRATQLTKETIGHWKDYSQININGAFKEVIEYQRRSEEIFNTYLNPNRADTLPEMLNQAGRKSFPKTPPPAWLNFANRHAGFNPNRSEGFRMDHYVSPLFEVPLDYDELARITVVNNLNVNLQERLIDIIPLRPQNGYINVRPITPPFFVFYTTFDIRNNKMRPKRDNSIPVQDFIVGVEKDSNVKTFYSLMVKSQPELPFLPGLMPWELTAVAAAQPFGSRIGPAGSTNIDDYTLSTQSGIIPMIRIDEERTIDDTQVLHDLKVATDNLEHTVKNRNEPILVPNEWDKRRYIFPDPTTAKTDISPVHFSDQITDIETGAYPTARGSLFTSFPNEDPRAGYSMKLVPIESIMGQLEPVVQGQLRSIKH